MADIHKPLLSTACAAGAGFDTWLGEHGGLTRHRESGEEVPVYRTENLYFGDMWVRRQGGNESTSADLGGQE